MRCPGYSNREYSRFTPLRQGYSKIARTVLSPERDAPRSGRDNHKVMLSAGAGGFFYWRRRRLGLTATCPNE